MTKRNSSFFTSIALVFLLSWLFGLPINAQEHGTLRGTVTDSTNSEALAYANIYIQNLAIGASTDARGFFMIPSVPAGEKFIVRISYMGYVTKTINVTLAENKITHVDIKLVPTSIELGIVEKISDKLAEPNATNLSIQKITAKELESLPVGVESDLFRAIQYLPGVQTTSDVSSKFYVRGGSSDQNLVLLNGATIYYPFHTLGLFSTIDPEVINSVEFYKGGFSSEFGGRLSSVLNIFTKDGNKNKFGGSVSASQLSGKAMIEGPIPYGSFIATARKSYSTGILKKFVNNKDIPIDFYDLSFKLNYSNPDFMPISKFTIHGFMNEDKLFHNDPMKEDYKYSNKQFGVKWFHAGDYPLYIEVGVYHSQFRAEVIPNLSEISPKRNKLDDTTIQFDFSYVYESKDEVMLGLKIMDVTTALRLQNSYGLENDFEHHGSNISVYGKYKLLRFDNFGADVGTRINLTRLAAGGGSYFFEPRASFTYRIIPEIAFKASWGIYQQDFVTVTDESEVMSMFDPWIITPLNYDPSSAIHYILGLEINPFTELTFSLEGYYKAMHNLCLLNEKKYFTTDPDFVNGNGEAYGVEFSSVYNYGKLNFSASYALSWTWRTVYDVKYPPRFDTRHVVNLIGTVDLGKGWNAGITWTFKSGYPYSPIAGYYDELVIDDLYDGGYFFDSYYPQISLAGKNVARLPNYHRMDLNLSKQFSIGIFDFNLAASIINVYDRANIFYFDYDTGERVNMLPFLPTLSLKVGL